MSEMIDRVAKVLKNDGSPEASPQYTDEARAVIEAMREPTTEMTMSGANDMVSQANVRTIWHDMIDAALAE